MPKKMTTTTTTTTTEEGRGGGETRGERRGGKSTLLEKNFITLSHQDIYLGVTEVRERIVVDKDFIYEYFLLIPSITPKEYRQLELIRLCYILRLCGKLSKLLKLLLQSN